MFPDDSVAQKQLPPNFCPTCAQIKGSESQNIRSCHACDAFREPKIIERGARRRRKLSMSFSSFPLPRRPIVLRSPKFGRGQNSKTHRIHGSYRRRTLPSWAVNQLSRHRQQRVSRVRHLGKPPPHFQFPIHTATTRRDDNWDEMPGRKLEGKEASSQGNISDSYINCGGCKNEN